MQFVKEIDIKSRVLWLPVKSFEFEEPDNKLKDFPG